MATIERKPLPPPNSTATPITEADRAEIMARANEVIDHYLNGPGSYFDSGTRKPLAGELEDNRVADLKNFKDNVIASMQFADDPNSIMRSVIELIDRTIEQVEEAARNNEGRDSISLSPPKTNDPIDDPRVISPRALGNAALPISLPADGRQPALLRASITPGISSGRPVRILSRRIADEPPVSAFDTAEPAAPDYLNSFGDRFGNGPAIPEAIAPRNPSLPVPPPQIRKPLGIFSGEPMPDWPVPPPIWDLPDDRQSRGEDNGDWLMGLLRSVGAY